MEGNRITEKRAPKRIIQRHEDKDESLDTELHPESLSPNEFLDMLRDSQPVR